MQLTPVIAIHIAVAHRLMDALIALFDPQSAQRHMLQRG
jgi:hypothetical protein